MPIPRFPTYSSTSFVRSTRTSRSSVGGERRPSRDAGFLQLFVFSNDVLHTTTFQLWTIVPIWN
jgi:hypothetical protein